MCIKSERPFNRVFVTQHSTPYEGLSGGIKTFQPITRCNSPNEIEKLRTQQRDEEGFQHYKPLGSENYHFTLPKSKDDLASFVVKPYVAKPFTRLSLDEIDVILRCKLQRHRHHIQNLFNEADCLHKGFITKAAFLRILHTLCREMQMDQFHRLLERYHFDDSPTVTFADFECTFGVPPVGQTKAPILKSGFGFDFKISVAFVFNKMREAAKHPDFKLKEVLPPNCFEQNGRILMPQLKEMLGRIRIHLTEENFRRLWEQKFDLMGVGSITTKQFLDQMNLDWEGVPKRKATNLKTYKFPDKYRLHYKHYDGNPQILKPNPCLPLQISHVSKPLGFVDTVETLKKLPDAGGISFPLTPQPTWKSAGPGGANVPPMGRGTRYKDRLEVLRKNRPRFRNVLENLQYIFEEPYHALMVVFAKTDPCYKGSVSEARLLDVLRECGMAVIPEDVARFAKNLACAVDDSEFFNEPPKGKEEQVRVGLVNYRKLLRRYQRLTPGSAANNILKKLKQKHGDTAGLKALTTLTAEEIEERLVEFLHKDYIEFYRKLESKSKDGGILENDLKEVVNDTLEAHVTACQWDEFKSNLPYKEPGLVKIKEFLQYFERPAGIPPAESTQIFTPFFAKPLRHMDAYVGEPRDLNILLSLLERVIETKFFNIDRIFKHFDHAGPGLISKEDFGEIMADQGLKLIPQELDAVWRLMDKCEPNRQGQHKFRQVMRFLLLQTRNLRMRRSMAKRAATIHDPNIQNLKEFRACQRKFKAEHKNQLLTLGKTARHHKYLDHPLPPPPSQTRVAEICSIVKDTVIADWDNIRNGFLWQDPTGWGSVLRRDFEKLARTFNFPLEEDELRDLAAGFDKDNNGHVDYNKFMHTFAQTQKTWNVELKFDKAFHMLKNKKTGGSISIRDVMDTIREKCLAEHKTLLAGFHYIGRKHPDYITPGDLGCFLKKYGIELSNDDLYHLLTVYDTSRRGYINYTDFLQQTMDNVKPTI